MAAVAAVLSGGAFFGILIRFKPLPMPFESYQPGKESREIDRAQREHVAGEEMRLGFARSHTETAKPMDTLKGMIKRAYREGKLYSEKQASEAAGEVVEKLQAEASRKGIDKIRINPGDRITFRNDSIALSQFDRTKGGFVDTRIGLMEEEGSIRREIVGAAQSARVDLSEELEERRRRGKRPENPEEDWEGKEPWEVRLEREAIRRARQEVNTGEPAQRAEATRRPEKKSSLPEQRQEAFRAFIRNTEELKTIISRDETEVVNVVILKEPKSTIPTQFKDYKFSEIIARRGRATEHYLIGFKPQTGEIVVFNAETPDKNKKTTVEDFSKPRGLQIALKLAANPQK